MFVRFAEATVSAFKLFDARNMNPLDKAHADRIVIGFDIDPTLSTIHNDPVAGLPKPEHLAKLAPEEAARMHSNIPQRVNAPAPMSKKKYRKSKVERYRLPDAPTQDDGKRATGETTSAGSDASLVSRVAQLEQQVAGQAAEMQQLRQEMAALRQGYVYARPLTRSLTTLNFVTCCRSIRRLDCRVCCLLWLFQGKAGLRHRGRT